MDTSTSELTELLAALHARDRTTARRSLLMTFAALLVGGAWLLYSFREVRSANSELLATQYKLQEETKALEEKERQLGEKTALLEAMRAKIGDAYSILTELDPLLLEFGWTKDNLTPEKVTSPTVRASLAANRELLNSPKRPASSKITLFYFPKEVDAQKVIKALSDEGFQVTSGVSRNDEPTNAIVFGSKVNPEDAKRVAYVLIRAGVAIKAIYRSSRTSPLHGKDRRAAIQVLSDPLIRDRPALTVEEIRSQERFPIG